MRAELRSSDYGSDVCDLRGGRRLARCGPITLAALLGVVAVEPVRAQQPTIGDRVVAAHGPSDRTVTEPAIEAGADNVITVFWDWDKVSRYALFDQATGSWVDEGVIPLRDFDAVVDLSIAYDWQTGDFMAAALARHNWGEGRYFTNVVTCRYDAQGGTGFGDPNDPNAGWIVRHGGNTLDKPWIVSGDRDLPSGQEYYIVYWGAGPYRYLRSVDAGDHWAGAEITVPDPNDPNDPNGMPVNGIFCAQPAVHADWPLYVAYVTSSLDPEIRFLVGEDVDGDPNDPNYDPDDPDYVGVSFSCMCGLWTPLAGPMPPVRVPIRVPLNDLEVRDHLPGSFQVPQISTVPYLVADPSNSNRLYIVYQDVASDDPNDPGYHDVNVYLQKLTKFGSDWVLGSRKQVNNDDTEYESDQFMPSPVVDDSGYIHVIFYDDRNYTDDPNDPNDQQPDGCPEPKFDVFYAWSPNQGTTWFNEELHAPQGYEEPAIDHQNHAALLREYIGITWYGDEDASQVWTAFNGTSQYEQGNKGVIWSSLIEW